MLNLKIAREILKVCDSKEEVKRKFLEHYGCQKAIRLIKRDYIRLSDDTGKTRSDYRLTFSCDNCGELFAVEQSDEADVVCPKCGFQKKIRRGCLTSNYLDDAYSNYSHILAKDERIIPPVTITSETISYGGKKYSVLRRNHFMLKNGEIVDVHMVKCIIVSNVKANGGILLRETPDGELKKATSRNAYSWFIDYKWREIPCENLLVEDDSCDNHNVLIRDYTEKYKQAERYYSRPISKARDYISLYPVNENAVVSDNGDCMEVYGNYFVLRKFCDGTEHSRWIYSHTDKVNVVMEFSDEEWTVADENNPRGYDDKILSRYRNILEKSFVGKRGVYLLLDRNDLFEYPGSRSGIEYLTELFDYPITESLVKVGLAHLISGVWYRKIPIDESRQRLWQKLGLSKRNYGLLFDESVSVEDCRRLRELNPYDSCVDAESFYKVTRGQIKICFHSVLNIISAHRFTYKQVIDYLSDVEETQGFESDDACEEWSDYLDMYVQYYGFEPKNREDKYPDSLKKAHDVISMRLKRKSDGEAKKNFAAATNRWKKLSGKDKNFIITLPQSSEDLARESDVLGHCVHSYSDRVLRGRCLILFLRRVSQPDMPFFTMEFNCEDRLVQIRGKSNREIEDISDKHKELRDSMISFLRKWGKKNHILTGYEAEDNAA